MSEIGASSAELGAHRMALRVYYEDTDAAGIVYHAEYLKFAERARTEMLRSLGFDHRRLREDAGIVFTVRRCAADYRAAARLDDALTVVTRIERMGGATIVLRQDIERDGNLLVTLRVEIACIDGRGRPQRLPGPLRTAMRDRLNPQSAPTIVQKTP